MHKAAECNAVPPRSFKRKNTELSVLSNKTQYTTFHGNSQDQSISLLMLESYLSDICKSISQHKSITEHSYLQVGPIRNILNDCRALSNVNKDFFNQVDTALNLLSKIYEYSCTSMIKDLVALLGTICQMISNKQHFSSDFSIPIHNHSGVSLDQCLVDLKIRINRLTPRVINVIFN